MRYRSVFLSDLHLGTRACKVDSLRRFLDSIETEHLFLVGDIVDLARMQRSWYWPASHRQVLQRLLDMSHNGTKVVYLPGNHDGDICDWGHVRFGDLTFAREFEHRLADGRRLLVTHGDIFDWVLHTQRLLGRLGAVFYAGLVTVNRLVSWVRRQLGMDYWSLADHVKRRVGKVNHAVGRFRDCLVTMARQRGVDAILAGHVHIAEVEHCDGVLYCNAGDWVDSCTAIAEDSDGQLRLLEWSRLAREAAPTPLPARRVAAPLAAAWA